MNIKTKKNVVDKTKVVTTDKKVDGSPNIAKCKTDPSFYL